MEPTSLATIDRHGGRVSVDDKRMINCRADVNQLFAAEIQMGVGEIPCRVQQSLDADGSVHAGRHRVVEIT